MSPTEPDQKQDAPGKLQLAYGKFINRFKDKDPEYLKIEILPEEVAAYEQKYAGINPWDKIGFARPLGGLFYNLFFSLIGLIIGILMAGFVITWLYPYPEGNGYNSIVGTLFALMFAVFDVGTAGGIERFVAEQRIKSPDKMLHYIQFFIWYQFFTGTVQTTVVSLMGLFYFQATPFAYLAWLILIKSTTQYPGFLGIFRGVLSGLQKFDKKAVLDFISGQGFQMVTNVIFILIGRYLGSLNPAVGELVGLAIGAALGGYIDDFFATWLSAHYFTREMKPFGFSARDCFRHDFSWRLAVSTMSFGLRCAVGPLMGVFTGFSIQMMFIIYIPQYATWAALASVASGIAGLPTMSLSINLTPSISESFLNGKNKLASFYIAQTWKYYGFFAAPFLVIIGVFLPVILQVVLQFQGAENYVYAVPFLLPCIIRQMQQPPTSTADMILVGASKPTILSIVRFLEEIGKLSLQWFWIAYLQLPSKDITSIFWIIPCGELPAILSKTIFNWIYIHKRIVKVKIPMWQFIIAPLIGSGVMLGLSYLYLLFAWPVLVEAIGVLASGVLSILIALFGLFPFYLFVYSFVGGFDEFGIQTLKDAIKMSGPSKPFIAFMLAFAIYGAKISPLHNKFPIESATPRKEAVELLIAREVNEKRKAGEQSSDLNYQPPQVFDLDP